MRSMFAEELVFYLAICILVAFMYVWNTNTAISTNIKNVCRNMYIFYILAIIVELLLSWSQNTLPLDNTLNTNILKVLTAVNTVSYTIGILFWFSYIYIRLKVGKISEIKAASVIALPAFIWAGVVITSIGTGLVFYFKDGLPYAGPIYKVHTMVDCMYLLSGFFIAFKSYFDSRNAEVEWRNASIVIISSVPLLLSEMLWPVFEGTALPLVALFLAYAILYFDRVAEYSSVDMVTGLDSKGMFKRKWRNILSRLPKDAKPYLFAIKIDSTLNEDYYNSEPMELAIKIVASQIKTYLATSEGMACCYKSNIFLLYLTDALNDPNEVAAAFEHMFYKAKTYHSFMNPINLYSGFTPVTERETFASAVKNVLVYLDIERKIGASRQSEYLPEVYSEGFYRVINGIQKYDATNMLLHDNVTDLYNQDGFMQCLRKCINSHNKNYVLVQYNIKGFGLLSSIYKDDNVQRIILQVGEYIQALREEKEGLVAAHIHEDRFLCAFTAETFIKEEQIERISALAKEFEKQGFSLKLQGGVCVIDNPNEKLNTYIDKTTIALRCGINYGDEILYYYDESVMDKIVNKEAVARAFPLAIENHEFHIYLQPQVFADGRLAGAEALVRWIDKTGSVISPANFIPILEEKDLVHELDHEIWRQAVETLAMWKNNNLTISVNLSTRDIFYIDVPKCIEELRKIYDFGNRLKIEITESSMIVDMERFIKLVNTLHSKGIQVEIDDFGSGFSSLNMLKDIHADILKIDMKFLSVTDERSYTVLRNVINMAHELDMKVICEGVEREDEAIALREMHCDMFQGYYYSKPISLDEFNECYKKEILDGQE